MKSQIVNHLECQFMSEKKKLVCFMLEFTGLNRFLQDFTLGLVPYFHSNLSH